MGSPAAKSRPGNGSILALFWAWVGPSVDLMHRVYEPCFNICLWTRYYWKRMAPTCHRHFWRAVAGRAVAGQAQAGQAQAGQAQAGRAETLAVDLAIIISMKRRCRRSMGQR